MDDTNQPDKWDRAFCHQQITGFCHQLNRLSHEYLSQYELLAKMQKTFEESETRRLADSARIGELSARLDQAGRVVADLTKRLSAVEGRTV